MRRKNRAAKPRITHHGPDRYVHPRFKAANGRWYEAVLSPKIRKPGDVKQFFSEASFAKWLGTFVGEAVAQELMSQLAAKKAAVLGASREHRHMLCQTVKESIE